MLLISVAGMRLLQVPKLEEVMEDCSLMNGEYEIVLTAPSLL